MGAHFGLAAERASASAARDRWQDIYWSDSASSAPATERPTWLEQPELWSDTPRATSPMPTAAPVARPVSSARPLPVEARAAVEHLEAASPVLARVGLPKPRTVRSHPMDAGYAHQRRKVHTVDIARYLQVNQAVHGIDANTCPMDLPRRGFAAEVALWKGREVGTPFLSGC